MKNILGLILITLASFNIYSQPNNYNTPKPGIISGRITDSDLNQPLEYANIVLFNSTDSSIVTGAITNASGLFKLEKVPFGRFYLVADFIGYNKFYVRNITITPKKTLVSDISISLKQAATFLEDVEIAAEKAPIVYKIDKKVVNVSQDITSAGGTAVDVLENTPSVKVDIEGNVTLRGSSSFTVLIDGKPSVLDGSDVLEQIPASAIENIEIITNPSAKYDPDGTAGIINVIMKKKLEGGFSGIVNVSAGTGDKYKTDVSLNYRTKKASYTGEIDFADRNFGGDGTSERRTNINDTTYYLLGEEQTNRLRGAQTVKAGVDYNISDKTSLSLGGKYGLSKFGMSSNSTIHDYTLPASSDIYTVNDHALSVNKNFYNLTMNLQHKFNKEGREIIFMADHSNRRGDDSNKRSSFYTSSNFETAGQPSERTRTDQDDKTLDYTIKLDYTDKFGKNGKLESGYQSRFSDKNEDYLFEEFDTTSGSWINNPLYSSDITFKRNIHSLYSTFSNKISDYEFMVGLRGELTDREITYKLTDDTYSINRIDLFPTFHISRPIGKTHQIQASYSRRIDRPRGWSLNPISQYTDPYTIRKGNPDLKPEYINSFELNYQKRIKSSFISAETYYRITENLITHIQTLNEDNIIVTQFQNLNKDYSLGLELMANLELSKWYKLNATTNIYNYRIVGDNFERSSTNWDLRLSNTFNLSARTRIQLDGNYHGPTVTAQGEGKGSFTAKFAVKQFFFDRKLTVTLDIRDIFGTGKHDFISEGKNFYSHEKSYGEPRVVTLSLSYKINNYKVERRRPENGDMDMDEGGY